jgi:ADP-heptose:LPS heptosyltransferase
MTVDFLNFLGATVENIEQIDPVIWLSETDKIFVDNLNLTTPVIGLFPSASNSIRNWSLSNYGLVAKNLSDKVTYIILGGSQDIELANKLKDELHAACPAAKVLNIAGKTTLRQLYVSICACTILISVESAALHMGIASGTPTVGIAGGGHYGRFVPWGNLKNNIIATNELSCFHCNWKCSREKIECIDGVSADDVVTAVTKLLPSLSRDYGLHGNKLC